MPYIVHPDEFVGPVPWETLFSKKQPLVVELGCGAGQFTLQFASLHPEWNIVGVDIKAARLWRGAQDAGTLVPKNLLFFHEDIQHIGRTFAPASISAVWMTFPDPWPRKKQAKHRLTSPFFMEQYRPLMTPNHCLHLKTDNPELLYYTVDVITRGGGYIRYLQENIDTMTRVPQDLELLTTFEKRHRAAGKKIHYLSWQFNQPGAAAPSGILLPDDKYLSDDRRQADVG